LLFHPYMFWDFSRIFRDFCVIVWGPKTPQTRAWRWRQQRGQLPLETRISFFSSDADNFLSKRGPHFKLDADITFPWNAVIFSLGRGHLFSLERGLPHLFGRGLLLPSDADINFFLNANIIPCRTRTSSPRLIIYLIFASDSWDANLWRELPFAPHLNYTSSLRLLVGTRCSNADIISLPRLYCIWSPRLN